MRKARVVAASLVVVLLVAGQAEALILDALTHSGYHVTPDADMDLDGNGGLMSMTPWATVLLTSGPGNRGMDFNTPQDFIDSGAIGQTVNYMNLFIGTFHAPEDGSYEFRNAGDDDRAGIWLDLDRDGVFESSTPGLGSNRGEQLSWEDGGTKTVTLTGGLDYMFAATHGQYGDNSRCDFRIKTPAMMGQRLIKPTDPEQAGLWTTEAPPVIPEPTTLSLMALGGLVLLRRRRRKR